MKGKYPGAALLLLLAVVLLGGCNVDSGSGGPTPSIGLGAGGTLRWAIEGVSDL